VKSTAKGPLAGSIEQYLAHKQSLGKRLAQVGPMLRLLDAYLVREGVADSRRSPPPPSTASSTPDCGDLPAAITVSLAQFGLLDGMVVHEMLPASPLRCEASAAAAISLQLRAGPPSSRSCRTTAQQPTGAEPRRDLQDDFCAAVWSGIARR